VLTSILARMYRLTNPFTSYSRGYSLSSAVALYLPPCHNARDRVFRIRDASHAEQVFCPGRGTCNILASFPKHHTPDAATWRRLDSETKLSQLGQSLSNTMGFLPLLSQEAIVCTTLATLLLLYPNIC
jgi:hypothetical protein